MIKEKAVIYARFSSDMQRHESIEAQVRACKEYAERKGYEVIEVYADEACSGTNDNRPAFQKMLTDSGKGKFSYAIVHKLNRFARSRYYSVVNRHHLNRNGVSLLSVSENIDGGPQSIILESIYEGMAEFFSVDLANEVEKGKRENALKGKHVGGIPPLGYDVDKETRLLTVNGFEAEAVKTIFSMCLDGNTYAEITSFLNQQGYRTKAGKDFTATSLNSILCNEKYTGVYVYSKSAPKDVDGRRNGHAYKADTDIIRVDGVVPALVSKEDFERVQAKIKSRKHRPAKYRAKRTYLLSGKIICGTCGTPYTGNCRPARSGHPEYISYRCNNRSKKPRCSGWEIRKELIEGIVLNELAYIVFDNAVIPQLKAGYGEYLDSRNKDVRVRKRALEDEIAVIQRKIDNIISVIMNSASGALVEQLNTLDRQKKGLEQQLLELETKYDYTGLTDAEIGHSFEQARELLRTGKAANVKALVERYVNKVIIKGEDIEIQFNLNVNSSRVSHYPATVIDKKEETPQLTRQDDTVVFLLPQHISMLVTHGGEGGI